MKPFAHFMFLSCLLTVGGVSGLLAQQNSFSAGSDFASTNYQVHVSVGQVFVSYKETQPLVQEGVLSILIELMVLQLAPNVENRFGISPNPFINAVSLSANMPGVAFPLQVNIFSLTGMFVETQWMYGNVTHFDWGHLGVGTYFIRVQVPGQLDYVQKIIKSN